MKITVSESAKALGILYPIFVIIRGVENSGVTPQAILDIAEQELKSSFGNWTIRSSEPEILGFRELFANMGYDNLVPAGERLVQTFGLKGFKSYGPLIDAYNTVALRYCVGIGMHDAASIQGNIHIDRATGQESIRPLFKNDLVKLKSGDLFYRDDAGVIAWIGKRDVDSDDRKVTESTKSVMMVILGNKFTTSAHNVQIGRDFFDLLSLILPEIEIEIMMPE
jgi:DNA/RNA-binding domain of Phe-tRNA-synthetase-like protein